MGRVISPFFMTKHGKLDPEENVLGDIPNTKKESEDQSSDLEDDKD